MAKQQHVGKPAGKRCSAVQINRHVPNFTCNIQGGMGHKVHIDPRTGQRWAHRGQRPFRTKKYDNRKLARRR